MKLPALSLSSMIGYRPLLLLLVPVLLSCKKDVDKVFNDLFPPAPPVQMPPETQAGANAFGCRVNGEVWEAKNGPTSFVGNSYSPNVSYFRGELRLSAVRRPQVGGPIISFYFTLPRVTVPGVYALGGSTGRLDGYASLVSTDVLVEYNTDLQRTGTLTLTRLDTTGPRPFAAGRFEVRAVPRPGAAVPAGLPAEVQVTDGRFDIQLNRP